MRGLLVGLFVARFLRVPALLQHAFCFGTLGGSDDVVVVDGRVRGQE